MTTRILNRPGDRIPLINAADSMSSEKSRGRRFSRFCAVFIFVVLSSITLSVHQFARFTGYSPWLQRVGQATRVANGSASHASHQKVAVIGGAGYIGSYLSLQLISKGYDVMIFDMNPRLPQDFQAAITRIHSRDLNQQTLAPYATVIFLGGCTGRNACAAMGQQEVEQDNISDVLDVIAKMSSDQHFIAASTSAISEGTHGCKEDTVVHANLLDEYSLSMFKREVRVREFIEQSSDRSLPRVSLLRFGTVVGGQSPSQRTDLMIPSFFRSAYTTGFLKVAGHNTMRSFLTLDDLSEAVQRLISTALHALPTSVRQYSVWNLASFDASVLKVATTVATMTGAVIDSPKYHKPVSKSDKRLIPFNLETFEGFTLDCQAFRDTFNFTFRGSLWETLLDFDRSVPDSIIAKGPHTIVTKNIELPCPVCGSTGQQTVLDLGVQPLANDFFSDPNIALTRPRFPLKLVRCKECNHYHLSHVVDRSYLFEHYLYQSGTSTTLSDYFEWLARKVIEESDLVSSTKVGTILELACNDGSQLDHFQKHGWRTFGVDPAANLVAIAANKNHTVRKGFWPLDFPELPQDDDLSAITAQNVLAHVPDVVSFLKGCAKVMGPRTKLYIQTSQCNMQQLGQFDTVYHEHISFFTGHSFMKASELAGLYITSFETTPIHGESCLVTMRLDTSAIRSLKGKGKESSLSNSNLPIAPSLAERLTLEKKDGVTTDFFATKFAAHAEKIRDWIKEELLDFQARGYHVGGYGAAAKGMVLFHFIVNGRNDGTPYLDFVLDDAKLKQNTFCPGTLIPVRPTDSIRELQADKPLVLLIFAWNFFDEIANRVKKTLQGIRDEVLFLVPFPSPRLVRLDLNDAAATIQVIRRMPFNPTPIPNPLRNPRRTKVVMITHQRNEELFMPFFIMHHSPMFDEAILIDFESDDGTLGILEKFAPPSWKTVKSTTGSVFDALKLDEQVMAHEKEFPEDWAVALTTTEFLVVQDFRPTLDRISTERNREPLVISLSMLQMYGNDTEPLLYFEPLPKQRHVAGKYVENPISRRYLHYKTSPSYRYSAGRHAYMGNGAGSATVEGLILKYQFTPWPESKPRKMNVGKTIPESDKARGFGGQHTARLDEGVLDDEYAAVMSQELEDLCNENYDEAMLMFHRTFQNVFGNCK